MTISINSTVKPRFIAATLGAAEAGANSITFTIDTGANQLGAANPAYTTPDFFCQVEVRSSAGALKPGVLPTYDVLGSGAGVLTIAKGTETFASGDRVVIVGKAVYV